MGILQCLQTGARCLLEAEHPVGRSPRASLRLSAAFVSAQHAALSWAGTEWKVRDLGSRNGTFVDGRPVEVGSEVELNVGSQICFGRPEQAWVLIDDSPPDTLLVPEDAPDEPLRVTGEVVALPTPAEPWATVFQCSDGSWSVETEERVLPLVSGQSFEVRGRRWRFSAPMRLPRTSTSDWSELLLRDSTTWGLDFAVSADEEHVQLWLERGGERIDLGSRSYNYLLLHLARLRLRDAESGTPTTAAGWVHRDDISSALRIDRENLNVMIFRIRKQLEALAVAEPASVIERRPDSHELRIGLTRLSVRRL
jgi:hypothetical protein